MALESGLHSRRRGRMQRLRRFPTRPRAVTGNSLSARDAPGRNGQLLHPSSSRAERT